jgi:hypothetical protein
MYRQSNPTSNAIRAESPSYTPGAKTKPFGSEIMPRNFVAAEMGGDEVVEPLVEEDMIGLPTIAVSYNVQYLYKPIGNENRESKLTTLVMSTQNIYIQTAEVE